MCFCPYMSPLSLACHVRSNMINIEPYHVDLTVIHLTTYLQRLNSDTDICPIMCGFTTTSCAPTTSSCSAIRSALQMYTVLRTQCASYRHRSLFAISAEHSQAVTFHYFHNVRNKRTI